MPISLQSKEEQHNRDDILAWKLYLNETVSLFCIAGFLSSLASPRRALYSLLYIVFILLFTFYKQLQLNSEYSKSSRKLIKTDKEKYNYKVSVRWYLSLITDIKENIVFLLSFSLLIISLFYGYEISVYLMSI